MDFFKYVMAVFRIYRRWSDYHMANYQYLSLNELSTILGGKRDYYCLTHFGKGLVKGGVTGAIAGGVDGAVIGANIGMVGGTFQCLGHTIG